MKPAPISVNSSNYLPGTLEASVVTLRSSSGQEVSHGDQRCDKQSTKTLRVLSHLQSELEQTDEAGGEDEE